eukprot:4473359-Amphidinium_carterae.1
MAFDGAPLADIFFVEFNDAEEVCNLVESETDLGDEELVDASKIAEATKAQPPPNAWQKPI